MAYREHFTNARTTALASGVGLVLAALSLQAGSWPHWIGIGAGYGSGLVMFLASSLFIAKSYYAPEHAIRPLVKVVAWLPVHIANDGLMWWEQFGSMAASAAAIVNHHGTKKQSAIAADGIAASLHFYDYFGSLLYIPKAYWLDEVVNHVTIPIGSTRKVLLGAFHESDWLTYENIHDTTPPTETRAGVKILYGIAPRRLPFTQGITVKITLYSQTSGFVLDEQVFPIISEEAIINREVSQSLWRRLTTKVQKL